MRLKLLFVIDNLVFGGGERVFLQLAAGLRERFEVFVAATPGGKFQQALDELESGNARRGIVVIQTPTTAVLGTHPNTSELIASIDEQETVAPLSKAALETLAIVVYRAP